MDVSAILGSNKGLNKKGKGKRKKRSGVKELLMLWILKRRSPIGRYRLKKMMGLLNHEGVVREMLTELQEQGYVLSNRSGSILTDSGKILLEKRLKAYDIVYIKVFDAPVFSDAPVSIGIHLQNRGDKIKSAMKLRDLAVRGGATGATIILVKENKLMIPSVKQDLFSQDPRLAKRFHETFHLKDNDVVAIISAQNEWNAVEASLTIAKVLS